MTLKRKYTKEIKSWNWKEIEKESCFLGTVFSIMPSGKYYMPWANSNVTESEAYRDEVFMEVLEEIAHKHGGYIEAGEGDPCDLFFRRYDHD